MTGLTYGSVCSGVEAASLAWEPLGLKPLWFAEIEAFPSAVLAERWPDVINLGDMTKIATRILSGEIPAPDVLVGGTPCQAFSIAGLREGLDDERGQLTLKFVELANAIDKRRAEEGKAPVIIIWENVPGVLNSHDNAFGNFLAALAGEDEAFEPGDRPATGKDSQYWTWNKTLHQHVAKWTKHGCVIGGERKLAWCVKDAQWFGVAQRRRRTFVVASARTGFDPSEVLFEPESVCRDTAPSRKTGQEAAAAAGESASNCSHWDDHTNPHPTLSQSHNTGGIGSSNQEVFSQRGAGIVAPCFGLDEEQNAGEELFGTLKAREAGGGFEGTVAYPQGHRMLGFGHYTTDETASTCKARDHKDATDLIVYPDLPDVTGTISAESFTGGAGGRPDGAVCGHFIPLTFPARMSGTQFAAGEGDVSQTITALNETAVCIPIHDKATRYKGGGDGRENDGSQNGLGIGKEDDPCPTLDTSCNHAVFMAFNSKDHGQDLGYEVAPTLRASSSPNSNESGGAPPAVAYAFKAGQGSGAGGIGYAEEQSPTLTSAHSGSNLAPTVLHSMAFAENERGEVRYIDADGQVTAPVQCGGGKPGQGYQAIIEPQMTVRRLTVVECERLQGMPDNHTLIPVAKYQKMLDDEIAYLKFHAPELPDELIFTMAKDGPRYKAIGNSMAVPVMRWIMTRILKQLPQEEEIGSFNNPVATPTEKPSEKVATAREFGRPFLKWAGGKFTLLDVLTDNMPEGQRLIEPFVGGGSVFMNMPQFTRYLLADVNPDLINLYNMLTIAPGEVCERAQEYYANNNSAAGYDKIKNGFNGYTLNAIDRAAAFLFLNRHCFNGLIRYNQKGVFNVGYGKYKAPYFPEIEIFDFQIIASRCVFMNVPFEKTLSLAGEGDVVYCDPPYEPLPGTDGFTGYSAGGFKWEQQEKLAQACVDAHKRGARVLITNSNAPKVLDLYKQHGFDVQEIAAKRSISSKGSTREIATDILAIL
ncbi:TPA: Dam family site-specific DNA-(adenine-N6)-methyltransferase [Enterobacter cloacae]